MSSWKPVATLLAAYAVVTVVAYFAGDTYVTALSPLLGVEVDALLPVGFERVRLDVAVDAGQRLLALETATTRELVVGRQRVPVGTAASATTLQLYALQHLAIVFAVLTAWPARSAADRLRLLVLGVPCVLVTTSLDLPFVLAGMVHELLLGSGGVETGASKSLALYYSFVHRGGRLWLAVTGAVAVAVLVAPIRTVTAPNRQEAIATASSVS